MEVYEKLRERLDKHPTGAPEAPEIVEILSILFTPEEAQVALGTAYRLRNADEIAERAGVSPDEAKACLESLADKGLVFTKEKECVARYALLPIMPGIFEIPFMKGEKEGDLVRLAELWHTYFDKLMVEMGSTDIPHARVVPIQEEVEGKAEVLPYDKVYGMIDRAKAVGIAHCACRVAEGNCDAPLEACMLFDDTCDFLVERGFAHYITKDEMKQKLREFDEAGLVHNVNNTQDTLQFVCNCCRCCCGFLRTLSLVKNPNWLATSGYIASIDAELCTGCAVCEERCPVGAIEVKDDVAVFDNERCIGCALCVTGCDTEAVELNRREEAPVPAETLRDLGLRSLQAKGKLEEFIEVNK